MIPLKDIFHLLASGEFANIAISKDRRGSIDESEYPKVIGHINLALVEIYKRFRFMEDELKLHVYPNLHTYCLRPEFMAPVDRVSTTRYIQQPAGHDGFINLIEIKDIFDEDENKLKINDRYTLPRIKQMSDDKLRVTGLSRPQIFSVVFQSHPSPISIDNNFDINTYILQIPKTILEAILYYVAARVYKPIGANNSTANADKSSNYEHKYELSCQKIEIYGLDIDDNDEDPDRFTRQGWA